LHRRNSIAASSGQGSLGGQPVPLTKPRRPRDGTNARHVTLGRYASSFIEKTTVLPHANASFLRRESNTSPHLSPSLGSRPNMLLQAVETSTALRDSTEDLIPIFAFDSLWTPASIRVSGANALIG